MAPDRQAANFSDPQILTIAPRTADPPARDQDSAEFARLPKHDLGHHMKEWLPAGHWPRVAGTFGRLDAEDVTAAHDASMDLFESISGEIAHRLGFPREGQLGARVRAAIAQNF